MIIPSSAAQGAELLHSLHVAGRPLVLFNAWDAGSARVIAEAGARAIATGSWSVAAAHGFGDGQQMPRALALENLRRIVASVALPVTIDLEAGYGDAAEAVAESITHAIAAGAAGCNLEDQVIGGDGLYAIEQQATRLRAAREAASRASVNLFLNARTDLFLRAAPAQHASLLDAALERARAYRDAGASGLFVPGLVDEQAIERICRESPLPVNIMVLPSTPPAKRLAELGVARISHGPGPYRLAMQALSEAAKAAHAGV
jgi:2-methylisocitrate lyase-like PEP mutase family enzyme